MRATASARGNSAASWVASSISERSPRAACRSSANAAGATPPTALRIYGPRLVPSFNYFQTAACLFAEEALGAIGVCDVARALIEESGFTPVRLANSLDDIVRRGHLRPSAAEDLRAQLAATGLLPPVGRQRRRLRGWWQPAAPRPAPPPAVAVDYRALVGAQEGAAE